MKTFSIVQLTSTRRPTTRPTRRPAVTTVTYGGLEYDATEASSGDEGDDEDVGEEEESTAFFENGRIRKLTTRKLPLKPPSDETFD